MHLLNPHFSLRQFFSRLKEGTALLMLDYDGTLAPFHPDPAQAHPYPGVMEKIQKIESSGKTRVVIISGRRLDDLLPLIPLKPLPELWGSHGSERLTQDGKYSVIPAAKQQQEGLKKAKDLSYQALRVEFKPTSLAVHFRSEPAERQEVIKKGLQLLWEPLARTYDLEIHPFNGGLELRAREIHKGKVVQTLLNEKAFNAIAYLGDDATDEDAFEALGDRGLKILVRADGSSTLADVQLEAPKELLSFFDDWLYSLS